MSFRNANGPVPYDRAELVEAENGSRTLTIWASADTHAAVAGLWETTHWLTVDGVPMFTGMMGFPPTGEPERLVFLDDGNTPRRTAPHGTTLHDADDLSFDPEAGTAQPANSDPRRFAIGQKVSPRPESRTISEITPVLTGDSETPVTQLRFGPLE